MNIYVIGAQIKDVKVISFLIARRWSFILK